MARKRRDAMSKTNLFEPTVMLYHLTSPKNVEAIERDGLRADKDGRIYAFTDLLVADAIAGDQVFIDQYALFAILATGVKVPLLTDDVAEMSRPFQCVIRQERIEPRYLRYLGTWPAQHEGITPWQWMKFALMGLSRGETETICGDACGVEKEGNHVSV